MQRTEAVSGTRGLVGVKHLMQGRRIVEDIVHWHLDPMDRCHALETVSLEYIQHCSHARRFDYKPGRSRHRTLRRMVRMWRQHEYLACIDAHVSDLSLVDDLQDKVAFTLIEELMDRIVVKIDPRIRPPDGLRNDAVFFMEQLVANGWFELVAELVDPVVEIDGGFNAMASCGIYTRKIVADQYAPAGQLQRLSGSTPCPLACRTVG